MPGYLSRRGRVCSKRKERPFRAACADAVSAWGVCPRRPLLLERRGVELEPQRACVVELAVDGFKQRLDDTGSPAAEQLVLSLRIVDQREDAFDIGTVGELPCAPRDVGLERAIRGISVFFAQRCRRVRGGGCVLGSGGRLRGGRTWPGGSWR
jgi:hypothetical protein